jgi:fumarate hydratase class II
VNPQQLHHSCAESRAALITALAPTLGYEHAARIVQRAWQEEKSLRQVIAEERLLSTEQLEAILDLTALAAT